MVLRALEAVLAKVDRLYEQLSRLREPDADPFSRLFNRAFRLSVNLAQAISHTNALAENEEMKECVAVLAAGPRRSLRYQALRAKAFV